MQDSPQDIWYISFLKHHLYDFTILSIWFLTDIISHFDAWLHICLRCSRCCRWNDVSTAKAWNAPSSIFRPLRCDERWKVGETCIVLRDRFLGYKQITYIKKYIYLDGGFKMFFIFTLTWGNDPIWLIFFKWVETTNQIYVYRYVPAIHCNNLGFGAVTWYARNPPETHSNVAMSSQATLAKTIVW